MVKTKQKFKRALSSLVTLALALGSFSGMVLNVSAAQYDTYIDPAKNWIYSQNHIDDLERNAIVTTETQYCATCLHETPMTIWRVPEYTISGDSLYNRFGPICSDGWLNQKGNERMVGTADLSAPYFKGRNDSSARGKYTGFHWTKSVCQICGNYNQGNSADTDPHSFGRNVFELNVCKSWVDIPTAMAKSIEQLTSNDTALGYDHDKLHKVISHGGSYCQFCYGTDYDDESVNYETHSIDIAIDPQISNHRFHVAKDCDDCGYTNSFDSAAWVTVTGYTGVVDGYKHSVAVHEYCDSDVSYKIRYQNDNGAYTLTAAPEYEDAGTYDVNYMITYAYDDDSDMDSDMTEYGTAQVVLYENVMPDPRLAPVQPAEHTAHRFEYKWAVAPTCTEIGYEVWQCADCGEVEKRNYRSATGHSYSSYLIRESSCNQSGLTMHICSNCGASYTDETPRSSIHHYETVVATEPTCTGYGFSKKICTICGNIGDMDIIQPTGHSYESTVIAPTCIAKGYTIHACTNCNDTYIDSYTDPKGHNWDTGTEVTRSRCESDGVIEYRCNDCDATRLEAVSATGHTPGAPATCTEPQVCTECNAILHLPAGHSYREQIVAPTCTSHGYTINTCDECGDRYISDYTDKLEHKYVGSITQPTCTEVGYTRYVCDECGDTYVSDYTAALPHSYIGTVTQPTCTEMGYTTFVCSGCGDKYVSDYTDVLPHNYNQTVIEPTCHDNGYTIYTCPDCGAEFESDHVDSLSHDYIKTVTAATCTTSGYTTYECKLCGESFKADYTDPIPHDFEASVTAPTCTKHGFTTYTCKNCEVSYCSDYTELIPHNYETTVTAPTCTELGYTTYTCKDCGAVETGNYLNALGHAESDWVVDEPATINNPGKRHKICLNCGEIISEDVIPKLDAAGYTDEEGRQNVGDYIVILTDSVGKPVFNSQISIDTDDQIRIKLPDEHLLSADDKITVTVLDTGSQTGVKDIHILVQDGADHAAAGLTDQNGQIVFPNNESNAGSYDVVTDNDKTYVVVVTDRLGRIIPGCGIVIGDNYSIDITLPAGTEFNSSNRVTVTVVDETGNAYTGMRIIVIGSDDYIEMGNTNANGQVTLPYNSQGYSNTNGTVNVNDYIVLVSDESAPIAGALVTVVAEHGKDTILVGFPKNTNIADYDNRKIVTVYTSEGNMVEGIAVNAYDYAGNDRTDVTDRLGRVVFPPRSEDIVRPTPTPDPDTQATPKPLPEAPDATQTPSADMPTDAPDSEPTATPTQNPTTTDAPDKPIVTAHPITDNHDYVVSVSDNNGSITNAVVVIDDSTGSVTVTLPDEYTGFDQLNRIVVTVRSASDSVPVKGVPVNVKTSDGDERSDVTNSRGQAVVPASATDMTDLNGKALVSDGQNEYTIIVENETGKVEDAVIGITDKGITVHLPEGAKIDYRNRVTVTVINSDQVPVNGMEVVVSDNTNMTRTGLTDINGRITVPPLNEDIQSPVSTDEPGSTQTPAQVIVPNVPTPAPAEDPGKNPTVEPDPNATPAPTEKTIYTHFEVIVEDNDGVVSDSIIVADEDGSINILLPDGNMVNDYNNRIKVTVTSDGNPAEGVFVAVKDKMGAERTGTTDSRGIIILPPLDEDMTDNTGNAAVEKGQLGYVVTVQDKDGDIENSIIRLGETGDIKVLLPSGHELSADNHIIITVTDTDNKPVTGIIVSVTDQAGAEAADLTDNNGIAIVPNGTEDDTDANGIGYIAEQGVGYKVVVENSNDGKLENAHIIIADGKISITLPDGKTIVSTNKTTVTVTDKAGEPVKGVYVTVNDVSTSKSGSTNANGQLTVPQTSSGGGGGGGSSRSSGGGGGGSGSSVTYNVTVTDKDGKIVSVSKSVKDGVYTLSLPKPNKLGGTDYYTVSVKDTAGIPQKGVEVVLKDSDSMTASGITDTNGLVLIPAIKHTAYIKGYDDGSVRPEGSMTRAEAAAIFARNISDRKNEKITAVGKSVFSDVKQVAWYYDYITYLAEYGVIDGFDDGTFGPDQSVSREQFVAMCTRFYKLFNDLRSTHKNIFTDVSGSAWSNEYISTAADMGWISGYNDGTFRPANKITRAEAVTIANAVLDRTPDTGYISKHKTVVNPFTDLISTSYWAYEDILSAANTVQCTGKCKLR